ncbi:hypothetical protein Q1695_014389 [Nippostrongylus brasiliensis]|nr:hypothetical protein Q1695_014389 [Nippostrongylus brasiliensis]
MILLRLVALASCVLHLTHANKLVNKPTGKPAPAAYNNVKVFPGRSPMSIMATFHGLGNVASFLNLMYSYTILLIDLNVNSKKEQLRYIPAFAVVETSLVRLIESPENSKKCGFWRKDEDGKWDFRVVPKMREAEMRKLRNRARTITYKK